MKIDNMKFTKTLKFKLTFWYSLVLSFFCILFIFSINVWLTQYMGNLVHNGMDRPRMRFMTEEQRELIVESRERDLENIRAISIYSIIPLVGFSFVGGYFLATFMLKPLGKLNKKIREKELDNISEKIDFDDSGDEISELIKSFNRMSDRLGKAFESQKQFVENASHEIKNPLSVIQANLDTILNEKNIKKKEFEKLLRNSKKQIEIMDNLTEDLLLLSHMNSKVDIKMENIDVFKLISSVINNLETQAKKKKMSLAFEENTKGTIINGSMVLLERALNNVVENSIKYSEGDKVRIVAEKKGKKLYVLVTDNGKGVPKKDRGNIFQRFYRVDKGRSRKEGGSGLGLAITKEILERHNGSISLDSDYKNGAKFVIILPAV
jgi:two-component system, OmpR family, sensor histidine kinase ArlS